MFLFASLESHAAELGCTQVVLKGGMYLFAILMMLVLCRIDVHLAAVRRTGAARTTPHA
jgi:hypothetical protein